MAEAGPSASDSGASPDLAASAASALGSATYEVIRQRLRTHAEQLRERMGQLDARRREVFGSIESKLLQADRITTAHNCIPQDLTQLDHGRFLFGFNVQFGLKRAVELGDVFAVFARDDEVGTFKEGGLDPLMDPRFLTDFKRLYHVYERTVFSKFALGDGHLFMVFRTGAGPGTSRCSNGPSTATDCGMWTGARRRNTAGTGSHPPTNFAGRCRTGSPTGMAIIPTSPFRTACSWNASVAT